MTLKEAIAIVQQIVEQKVRIGNSLSEGSKQRVLLERQVEALITVNTIANRKEKKS